MTGWAWHGCAERRHLWLLRARGREPVPVLAVHRLGRGRRLRGVHRRARRVRLRLPEAGPVDEVALAPLLCAGIIGYRRCGGRRCHRAGGSGLTGSGGSAHLCAQVALAEGATVHVLTRGAAARRLALGLGAASAQDAYDMPPEPLDSAILFAPVGDLVPVALRALDRGGTLSIAGIHLSDTRRCTTRPSCSTSSSSAASPPTPVQDGEEFLALAARHDIHATTHAYPLTQADRALRDLKAGRFDGAAVLVNDVS